MKNVRYHRECDFGSQEAVQLIRKFLNRSWTKTPAEDVHVSRVQEGLNNQVYIVSRDIKNDDVEQEEPNKVIVRKYGGNLVDGMDDFRPNSVEEQVLIFNEASKVGVTPRLFGVFRGGRIEEFIESRHLEWSDMSDRSMRRQVAQTLATYHSLMHLPLPKPSYSFSDVLKDIHRDFIPVRESYLKHQAFTKYNIDPTTMGNYNFKADLDWIECLLNPENHTLVLMHWDTQLMNILVRKEAKPGEMKVMLIDIENTSYNIRGKDLGLLFSQKLLSDFENGSFPTEEECKAFLQDYQDEASKVIPHFDPNGKDSLDHLYFESLIGTLVSALCFVLFVMRYHKRFFVFQDSFAQLNYDEFKWYLEARETFIKRFPEYAPLMK